MAQPHKGPRKQVFRTLDAAVKAGIVGRARHLGIDTSTYIADLLAIHVGRPDLARELQQNMLGGMPEPEAAEVRSAVVTPRLPQEVYAAIALRAAARKISMAQYLEDVCAAHVHGRELAPCEQEELLLNTG